MTRESMLALQKAERARDARKRAIQDGRPAMAVAKLMRAEVVALIDAIGVIESTALVGGKS